MNLNNIDEDRLNSGLLYTSTLHSVKELNQCAITDTAHKTIAQVIDLLDSLSDSDFYVEDDYDDIPF